MAYFRTDKYGNKQLILTAKDKAKHQERFGYTYRRPIRAYNRTKAQQEIAWAYRCYSPNIFEEQIALEQANLMQQYQRLYATLRWVRGGEYTDDVSATGSVDHVRGYINDIQSRIRHYRWLMNHAR